MVEIPVVAQVYSYSLRFRRDMLYGLVFMGDLPLPTRNSTPVDSNSNKWPSDNNNSASTTNWNLEDQVSASNPPPLASPLQADHIDDPHARHIHENAHTLQLCLPEDA